MAAKNCDLDEDLEVDDYGFQVAMDQIGEAACQEDCSTVLECLLRSRPTRELLNSGAWERALATGEADGTTTSSLKDDLRIFWAYLRDVGGGHGNPSKHAAQAVPEAPTDEASLQIHPTIRCKAAPTAPTTEAAFSEKALFVLEDVASAMLVGDSADSPPPTPPAAPQADDTPRVAGDLEDAPLLAERMVEPDSEPQTAKDSDCEVIEVVDVKLAPEVVTTPAVVEEGGRAVTSNEDAVHVIKEEKPPPPSRAFLAERLKRAKRALEAEPVVPERPRSSSAISDQSSSSSSGARRERKRRKRSRTPRARRPSRGRNRPPAGPPMQPPPLHMPWGPCGPCGPCGHLFQPPGFWGPHF